MYQEKLSLFQTTKPRTTCTRLQLILVLGSFIGSLATALALTEKPIQKKTEAMVNKKILLGWEKYPYAHLKVSDG
ncbi:MAG: hypothetical protein KC505_00975 [Myxococcales bacterium]|nr:hypothetical protein [Myxococcales bacterium]USN50333.1 MAG: hypothetical protein H6731_08710 [Myxococcales bacterium]